MSEINLKTNGFFLRKFLFFILPVAMVGCTEYTPRPKGYPRIEFPEKAYTKSDSTAPFRFEIPVYARLVPDQDFNAEPFWYNLYFPGFDATLHLSYKALRSEKALDSLIEDARKLVFKHTIKAEEIEEREVRNSFGNTGMFYDLSGNTATPLNFFMTDQKRHYIRGAFYFNNYTERDSVAPVAEFVKEDVLHLIRTLQFSED